jgi:hypothetical protein
VTEAYGGFVPLDDFLVEVLPYSPQVPEFVAINAIRNAAIEFCERTEYLQHDIDPIPGVANLPDYEIETPTDTVFLDVIQAWYNGVLLIPKSVDELSRIYRSVDWHTLSGNPAYITRVTQPFIQLVPYPAASLANAITGRITIAPSRDATTVPHRLFEHYVEVIGMGARARLYDTPGQPYSNPRAAADLRQRFFHAIGDARRKVNKNLSRASVTIEFQRWA